MINFRRNKLPAQTLFACAALSIASLSLPASAAMTRLQASVPMRALAAEDKGPVDDEQIISGVSIQFKPSAEQEAALQQLLTEQQRPGSPLYHQWLTPEQYADQFGADPTTVSQVSAWLETQGLTVVSVSPARTSLRVSGSAAQFSKAFRTSIHRYQENGASHFSNAQDLWLPDSLLNSISGVRNLSDFRPHAMLSGKVTKQFTSSSTGAHFLTPGDVSTIYNIAPLYQAQITGSGQTIAVVGQSAITTSDIDAFRSAAGLGAKHLTVTLVPNTGSSVIVSGDTEESALDIEWSGGIARDSNIIFYYAGSNQNTGVFDAVEYAVNQNSAAIISISYGLCESQSSPSDRSSLNSIANQANSQGQTLIAASGDAGAAGCDNDSNITAAKSGLQVNLPASLPQVTAIGGTTFASDGNGAKANTTYWNYNSSTDIISSALSYIPETSWNDTSISSQGLLASGGGKSRYFSKPSWQTGTGVPADGMRDVPDISFSASPAHDSYLICSGGSCVNGFRASDGTINAGGGTSFGTPVFAGILALLEQNNGTSRSGNINSALYSVAGSSSNYATAFHDVTTGNNIVPCTSGTTDCPGSGSYGYSAGTGYDQVTGLGSLNVYALTQITGTVFSSSATGNSSTGSTGSSGSGSSGSGGGGGGGAMPLISLLGLAFAAALRRRKR